jgi:serine phosphatase RsbU (regulator of sigma subunit)/PAS domain-containing protein
VPDPIAGAAAGSLDDEAVETRPLRSGVPLNRQRAAPSPDAGRVLGEIAIAAAGIGAFEWDLATGRLSWDDVARDLLGLDAHAARTLGTMTERVHPEDRARVVQALDDAVRSDDGYDQEYRVVLPGGTTRWISARGRVLREVGRPVRMLGAAYDTTERRRSETRIGEVLESMPTAFFSVDTDWRFTYVNAEAERVLDRPRQALLGGDLWELFPAAVSSVFEDSYRGAMRAGIPASFDAYYPAPLDAWFEVRAWPGPEGLAVYFLDITARRHAEEQAGRTARRAALVAKVTAELSETLDGEQAVARLAQLVVPELAEWCLVTLVDDDEQAGARRGLRDIGWWHADPDRRPLVEEYAATRIAALRERSFLSQALSTADTVTVQGEATRRIVEMLSPGRAAEVLSVLAPETAAVLPLRGRTGVVGLITLFNGPERGSLTAEEAAMAAEVATRAGLALDNSRLYRHQRQLAEGLQRALLTEPPHAPGLRLAVRYEPAAEAAQVGGDWYDAFLQRDGGTVLVIGDVVGHDIVAAASMGQLRSVLRGIAVATGAGPAELLEEVDHAMVTLQFPTLATAVVATIEPATAGSGGRRTVRWSNAGHPPPVVVGPDGSVAEIQAAEPDLLLGVVPDARRGETVTVLDAGATLFLYTDGLVERRDLPLEDGIATLHDVLRDVAHEDLHAMCDAVLRRMLPATRTDDVAVVAVRLEPRDPSDPPPAP